MIYFPHDWQHPFSHYTPWGLKKLVAYIQQLEQETDNYSDQLNDIFYELGRCVEIALARRWNIDRQHGGERFKPMWYDE